MSVAAFALASLCVTKAVVGYAPWTIPLTLAIVAPTLVALLSLTARRLGLACAGGVLVGTLVLVTVLVLRSGAVDVIAGTVYPGERRSTGEFVGWDLLFGAPHLWILQTGPEILAATNESEVATGFLVLAVPSLVLAFGTRWGTVGRLRGAAIAEGAVLAGLSSWVLFDWPDVVARRAVPLTLVQPERMAQVLGLAATILFAFTLSAWRLAPRSAQLPTALVAAALAAGVTVLGGRTLRAEALPTLPVVGIAVVSFSVAAAVGLAVWRPDAGLALAALPLLAGLVVFAANPLQQGFGVFRSSSTATRVRAIGASLGRGRYWASDDSTFDALLMSNGESALSGQQWVGPPGGVHRRRRLAAWNRGASFIVFRWVRGEPTRIVAPKRDVIQVRVDPCSHAVVGLGLRLVVSRHPLTSRCLASRGQVPWGDSNRWIYAVSPTRR